ncbi:MAG: hypothetical protein ACJ8AO_14920 [Gemmatimonadaceae bacterium]
MAKQNNPGNQERSGRPVGPDSRDPNIEAQEAQRNNLRAQGDYQASPDTDQTDLEVRGQTGNATRAQQAAMGTTGDESNRREAEDAFRDSRGDRGPRGEQF